MSFSIEITPKLDAKGAIVHTVVVTIDFGLKGLPAAQGTDRTSISL
jgi:hypothetical protein